MKELCENANIGCNRFIQFGTLSINAVVMIWLETTIKRKGRPRVGHEVVQKAIYLLDNTKHDVLGNNRSMQKTNIHII